MLSIQGCRRDVLRILGLLAASRAGPVGSQAPPVTVIHDLDGLQAMRERPEGHYLLGRPLDASATAHWNQGAGFAPVGSASRPFSGSFDGGGHAIHGLFIHRPGDSHVGLWGYARNATLRKLRLEGARVTGADNVGLLAGHHEAVDGQALISAVQAAGVVAGSEGVGGLVGHHQAHRGQARISAACATAQVMATGSNVGGLVGHNEAYGGSASIVGCHAWGPVAGRDYVGGLVGYNDALQGAADVLRSLAMGVVHATGSVAGGLVGLHTQGRIADSFYANTDAQGRAINRFAHAQGTGLAYAALLLRPEMERRCGLFR